MGQLARSDGARAPVEMRDEGRRAIDSAPHGDMFVKDRHEHQRVLAIRDLSLRGVSLCVSHGLVPGEPVVIELRRGPEYFEFYAYVAWCRPRLEALEGDTTGDLTDALSGGHVAGLRVYGAQSLGKLVEH